MVDIGAGNFVLATLNPLMREGGLLAALPADKAAFEAQFRLAGARAGAPDNPSAPRTQQPASHQYKSSEPVVQQRPGQAESSAAAQRDDERQYESASAAPQAAQPQSGQPAEAHRQHDETAGKGNNQPQEPRDSVAADQSKPADCKHTQSCEEPRAESDQQQSSGNQFVTSEESASATEAETAAAMSLLEATAKINKSQLHQHLPDAPIADANVQAANDGHTSMSAAAADQSVMQSAIQPGMQPAMQTANGGDSGASGDEAADFLQQSGMAAAAIATDPIADAVLADDKPRPMRVSGRSKSSPAGEARGAVGEVRGAGDANSAQKEQAAVGAAGQTAVSQAMLTAAAGDAFATQRAGESASGKSDAALNLARQNSEAQQAPITTQAGKEKASAAANRPSEASTSDKLQGTSTVDRVRFVQRVARAFEAIGARAGTVRLRLSPPELGTLRVEIAVRDGALSARLQAENHTVRNLLLDNLPALRERLAQQDIRIDRFQVDIFDQSQTSNWQQPTGQSDQHQPGRYRAQLGEPMTPLGTQSVRLPTGVHRSSSESQLDVLI